MTIPSAPRVTVPVGACDCHTHVFDPATGASGAAAYALPDAPYPRHRAMLDAIGAARAVVVQPSAYRHDHRVLLDAIARSGGRLRGVGLLDGDADDAAWDALDSGGVTALRFVEARVPGSGERYPGNVPIAALDALRPKLVARGWHAEVWAPLAEAAAICEQHAGKGVPIVLDHMAGAAAETDPRDPAFRAVLDHVARGDVWVKLVLCRTAARLEDALRARRLHEALLAANPARLLWGTDFPFIRKGEHAPDAGTLIDLFAQWTPDPAHRRAILVDNPAALYRFPSLENHPK